MSILRSVLFLAVIIYAPTVWAQKRFQPGYLVLQRGDTLRGIVEAPTRSTVARGVFFRTSPEAKEKQFYPVKTLRGVGLTGGKTYVMHKMQPVINHDTLRLLLEPLVQGRAVLYRSPYNTLVNNPEEMYANQLSFVYYYIERPVDARRAPYLLQADTFRQALRSIFSDCPAAPAVTGNFTESNLVQLVQHYNACSDSPSR